jgi:anthranilate synthase/aminodeoxychorismate synthase-like glutamine amidotransferase
MVHHHNTGVFTGLESPLQATRYHSLVVEASTLPAELMITATTDDGMIMGMRHRDHDVEGVQFHPESILTNHGHAMLANFLARI